MLSALIFLQCAREFCCPKGGNITMILWFSAGTALFGAAMLGFCMYCLFYDSSFVAEYVGDPTLISCTVVGWALVVTSALTVYGVKRKMGSPRALLLVFVAYFVLLLLQLALAVIAVLWVQNLDAISNDTLETLRGTSNGRHDGKFGAALLGEMEAFTCQTYTLCCWDPALDLMNVNVTDGDARCRTPHAGDNQIQCAPLGFEVVAGTFTCPAQPWPARWPDTLQTTCAGVRQHVPHHQPTSMTRAAGLASMTPLLAASAFTSRARRQTSCRPQGCARCSTSLTEYLSHPVRAPSARREWTATSISWMPSLPSFASTTT